MESDVVGFSRWLMADRFDVVAVWIENEGRTVVLTVDYDVMTNPKEQASLESLVGISDAPRWQKSSRSTSGI